MSDQKISRPRGRFLQYPFILTLEEFRKASLPISIGNPISLVFSAAAVGFSVYFNYKQGKPYFTGGPRIMFMVAAGIPLGYFSYRFYHQYYMGKFKYCYEYAMSRKDDFPPAKKAKFGDPEELHHYIPYARW